MAASLPWRRDEKPAEISWLASDPGGTGPADHATSDDPRRYRVGTISTSNAIRAFSFDGDFGWLALEVIEGCMPHHGQVDCGVVLAGSAIVLPEGDVELPMQVVFDAPMRPAGGEKARRIGRQRGDIEPRFGRGRTALFVGAHRGDRGDGAQARPLRMPLGEPSCVGGPGHALLDPAVTGFNLPVREPGTRERRVGEEISDIGMEGALVFFEREDIIGLLLDDLGGDGLLRPDRVDGHNRALDRQHVEKLGDGGDFIALGFDRTGCEHQPSLVRKGRNNMQGTGAALVLLRPAQGLAVDRHDAKPSLGGLQPTPKRPAPAPLDRAPAEPGARFAPARRHRETAENGAARKAAPRRTSRSRRNPPSGTTARPAPSTAPRLTGRSSCQECGDPQLS